VVKFPNREGKRRRWFREHKAMVSSRVLLFFVSAIFMLTAQAVARPAFDGHFCMLDKGNYTDNSTYKANFNDLLFSLSSNTEIDHGLYNSTYGRNPDQVHAIGLCRGDVDPDVCRGCLNNAAFLLTESCPLQKEAIGWYEKCMLRYSNRSILGFMETSPSFYMWSPTNVSANSVNQFNDDLRSLLESLRSEAAARGPHLKFAAGNAPVSNFRTLYALVQCTPDLSEQDCNNCLVWAFQRIPLCCDGKQGGRVITPSCNIRFEPYPFYSASTTRIPTLKRSKMGTANTHELHYFSWDTLVIYK
jgi:hypothetical protein